VTALVSFIVVLTSIFSLKNGIFEIFQYFFIIPVILIAYTWPRFAVYFTILIGWLYLAVVYYYGPFDIRVYTASSAWFYVFVTLGVVISAFSNEIAKERKFRTIFLNSQAGLFIVDHKTGLVVVANAPIATLLGYSEKEMVGLDGKKVFSDEKSFLSLQQELEVQGKARDREVMLQKKDGTGAWVLLSASLTRDGQIIFSAIDITEKKKVKDELIFQEIHYRTLFDNAGDAIIIHDFDGRIFEANTIACEKTGYTEDELKNRSLRDLGFNLWSGNDTSWIDDLRYRGTLVCETTLLRKDGTPIPIEMSSKAIEYYRSPSVISILRDITARKRAEDALRESEKRYRMIGELIPFGVWITDDKGIITYASPSFLDLVGMTLEECQTENWMTRLPADVREQAMSDWRHCVEGGYFWDYEYRILDRNGREHFVLSRGAPLKDSGGKTISWVGIHLDITDRRHYEERIEASLREKEVIIKEVHHRVKNNMQVISGFLQLQAQYINDPDSVAMLEECQGRVRTMALVHEKLYQSRYVGFINAREYIESLVSDLKNSYILQKDVSFELDIEDMKINLDIAIPCGLILNELLTNSLKYAFPGRDEGKITVKLTLGDDHFFTLFVSDDGTGLPPDLDIANAPTLGLQIITILVRQMGGTMDVGNAPGATFRIRFPEKF